MLVTEPPCKFEEREILIGEGAYNECRVSECYSFCFFIFKLVLLIQSFYLDFLTSLIIKFQIPHMDKFSAWLEYENFERTKPDWLVI